MKSRLPNPSVVLFAADVPSITEFYRSVADMSFVSGDASHSVLELEYLQLVVHAVGGRRKPILGAGKRPKIRRDANLKVCLPVSSIESARTRAASLGGRLHSPDREWEARGFRACDGHDPEGNVFQVRELAGARQGVRARSFRG
jgi:predicted enzyme related to lactoylglutathione lyase